VDAIEADKSAIMAALRAETDAWLRRDFDALAGHWVHAPETRRMEAFGDLGTWVDEGWDAIGARLKLTMERFPQTYELESRIRWERVNILLGGNMAWVSYDVVGFGPDFEMAGLTHELKIFHRIDGAWKIGCLALMHGSIEHEICPLIQVDADATILWMNLHARSRMAEHPGLHTAAGRLRARARDRDAELRAAILWAHEELHHHVSPMLTPRRARAVQLGEDAAGVPLICWVVIEDGKALVSFDDDERLGRRIAAAAELYRLSPAQTRLARLIVEGYDLAAAAGILGVSVNTLRTQLQRMFDKTGARSQAALLRILLSADVPTK
jgi:DNA-binding CsgD family transcriptional regulator